MREVEQEIDELKKRVASLEKLVSLQQEKIASINLTLEDHEDLIEDYTENPLRDMLNVAEPGTTENDIKETLENNTDYRPSQNLETLIGGTWLNRIGVVAFIIGMGFFLKYAFDNNWIGPTGRIIIGIIVGLAFLTGGELAQKKDYRIFAQGLTGGGFAVLYFSIFAAYNFYSLIGLVPAFGLMIIITTTAVLLSVRYDSLAIAILGIIGGFLTPFMLNNGEPRVLALFTYIAILDLGILALAYYKNWRSINLLSFVFTQAVILSWWIGNYSQSEIGQRETIFVVFFVIFALLACFHNIIHKRKSESDDLVLIALNGALFFLYSYINLNGDYHWFMGYLALLLSLLYLGLSYLTYLISKEDRLLIIYFTATALSFLTLAIPMHFHQTSITITWAIEGFLILGIGFYLSELKMRQTAWIILGLVSFRLLFYDTITDIDLEKIYVPLANGKGFTYLIALAALWGGAYLYSKYRSKTLPEEKNISMALPLLGNFLLLFFLSTENIFYFDSLQRMPEYMTSTWLGDAKQLTLSGIWGIYSIILIIIGILKKFQPVRIFAIILFGITILKVFFFDLSYLETFYRIISFIGLGLILIMVSFLYQRFRKQIMEIVGTDSSSENIDC